MRSTCYGLDVALAQNPGNHQIRTDGARRMGKHLLDEARVQEEAEEAGVAPNDVLQIVQQRTKVLREPFAERFPSQRR